MVSRDDALSIEASLVGETDAELDAMLAAAIAGRPGLDDFAARKLNSVTVRALTSEIEKRRGLRRMVNMGRNERTLLRELLDAADRADPDGVGIEPEATRAARLVQYREDRVNARLLGGPPAAATGGRDG